MKKLVILFITLPFILFPKEIVKGIYYSDNKFFKNSKLVHLSFDDGIGGNTLKLLNILKRNNIRASFFIIGETIYTVENSNKIIRRILNDGHIIGNHTMGHYNFKNRGYIYIRNKIIDMTEFFNKTYNYQILYFRPPFGINSNKIKLACKKLNMYFILWTIDSKDWRPETVDVFYYVRKEIRRDKGGVIILHDRKSTVDKLEYLIRYLKISGMKFVGLDEIILYKYKKSIDIY